MISRGRTLKFTAVIALVVLALTGFSTGSKGGSKGRYHGSRHGSGGGCSSSRQDHDTSSSSTSGGGSYGSSYDDDDNDSYGSSGSSGGSSYTRRPTYRSTPTSSSTGSSRGTLDGTAKLVSCATEQKPYATVQVTNPNGHRVDYWVDVRFKDARGNEVVQKSADVEVPAKGKATAKVFLYSSLIDQVDHCEVDPEVYGS